MIPQTEVPVDDKVSTAATPAAKAATPKIGYASSEFATTVAAAVAIASGHIPANYLPLFSAVTGLYVAARTVLKAVHALGYAKAVPDLPDVNLQGLPK